MGIPHFKKYFIYFFESERMSEKERAQAGAGAKGKEEADSPAEQGPQDRA